MIVRTVLKDLNKMVEDNTNYRRAFYILMEYFDSISDEEKPKVSKRLNKIGL